MIILDFNNLLHRVMKIESFYGLSFQGIPTGGVYGGLTTLRTAVDGLFRNQKKIGVWDGLRSSRRLALYGQYKGNREAKTEQDKKIAQEYFSSFNQQKSILVNQMLPCLGVSSVQLAKEADDVIYQICNIFQNEEITIFSEDNDLLQLINFFPKVRVYKPIKKILIDKENFESVVELPLSHFLLYKAMLGDKGDNISGVEGVGETTVKKIINSLDKTLTPEQGLTNYLKDIMLTKKTGRELKLAQNVGNIVRNLELVDLSREPFANSDLDFLKTNITSFQPKLYINEFRILCQQYGFTSILREFNFWLMPFYID